MISRRPASGKHRVAAGQAMTGDFEREDVGRKARAHAHRRLRCLYEVSKLLTVFDDVEETVRAVLSVMAPTLPLRSAVLLLGSSERPRTFAWKAKGLDENALRLALAHAQTAHAYLVGSATVVVQESTTSVNDLPGGRDESRSAHGLASEAFILLPLVIDRRPIFGTLQVEGGGRLDESDLAFVNSVVNQLALAIDRHAAIEAARVAELAKRRDAEEKQAWAEQAARVQHFLAELSAGLGSSLQYRNTLATCARLAIPFLADVCVIDHVAEEGAILRLEVALADENTGELAERVRKLVPKRGSRSAPGRVLDTGEPILIPDVDSSSITGLEPECLEVMRALHVLSVISVPLVARGRTLGVLSFGSAGSGRRYGDADLALALEVGRRTAMAMDNARLHEQTEKAVEQREDVLAIVSHDLRNPLSAILAVTQLLLRAPPGDAGRIDDQAKIKLIRRTAERMDRLIRDLLDMSSIDAGHLSLDVHPVGLGDMIGEALEILRSSAEGKSLRIDVDVPTHDFQLRCDRTRVVRVLLNLVGNAIKFTLPGGSIRISAEQASANALIKILDTGPGIAADRLTHVFERYWQAHETASSGTGLGLYISKGIVEAHGGSIWAESMVGKGSAFLFTLPLNVPTPFPEEANPKGD